MAGIQIDRHMATYVPRGRVATASPASRRAMQTVSSRGADGYAVPQEAVDLFDAAQGQFRAAFGTDLDGRPALGEPGFVAASECALLAAGIPATEIAAWIASLMPECMTRTSFWVGEMERTAAFYREGFNPEQAHKWARMGVSPASAAVVRNSGRTPEEYQEIATALYQRRHFGDRG